MSMNFSHSFFLLYSCTARTIERFSSFRFSSQKSTAAARTTTTEQPWNIQIIRPSRLLSYTVNRLQSRNNIVGKSIRLTRFTWSLITSTVSLRFLLTSIYIYFIFYYFVLTPTSHFSNWPVFYFHFDLHPNHHYIQTYNINNTSAAKYIIGQYRKFWIFIFLGYINVNSIWFFHMGRGGAALMQFASRRNL